MNNLRKNQNGTQCQARVIPPNAWNANYVVNKILTWLKQEKAFPYDNWDLDLMPYGEKFQYERNRKTYLSNKDLNLYRSKICITYPNMDGVHINGRDFTKLCRGYLVLLEANSNTVSPFSIAKVDVYLEDEKLTLRLILKGR